MSHSTTSAANEMAASDTKGIASRGEEFPDGEPVEPGLRVLVPVELEVVVVCEAVAALRSKDHQHQSRLVVWKGH